jgi:pimeloyl-ACP methyl ester carboxylesterase
MPRMVSTLLSVAVLAALLVVALVGLVWWRQERIVFQPPRPPYPMPERTVRVTYTAEDGQLLFAYLVHDTTTPVPTRHLLIAFHGNADLAGWLVPWAREVVRRTGWAVLLPEYRGYGGLGGTPTYDAGKRDARAALAFARDRLGVAPSDAALFGHSLGTAIATELAIELATESGPNAPRALVLQSPFTSARAMARRVVFRPALWFWRVISRVHYDTEASVRGLGAPVWVAHGDRDFIVPLPMGVAVHQAAPVRGELLVVRGAGHNDVVEVGGEAYWRWLARALGSGPSRGLANPAAAGPSEALPNGGRP